MATKKPAVKKTTDATAKKPAKTSKKPMPKKAMGNVKPAVKEIALKKIVVKPAKPTTTTSAKKPVKKGNSKPMTKMVVDRIALPKGGKIFVKAAKRPTAKKPAKRAK